MLHLYSVVLHGQFRFWPMFSATTWERCGCHCLLRWLWPQLHSGYKRRSPDFQCHLKPKAKKEREVCVAVATKRRARIITHTHHTHIVKRVEFLEPACGTSSRASECRFFVLEGRLHCFGDNIYGQCSVPIELASTTVVSIAAGFRHSCAVTAQGVLLCFGDNRILVAKV